MDQKLRFLFWVYRHARKDVDKISAAIFLAANLAHLGKMRFAKKMSRRARYLARDNYDELCGITLMEGLFFNK